jgi:signal transduction histidine kinase
MHLHASQGSGIGLRGMEERLWLVGGQIDITSTPGRGTEIRARLPVTGRAAEYAPVATTEESAGEPPEITQEH